MEYSSVASFTSVDWGVFWIYNVSVTEMNLKWNGPNMALKIMPIFLNSRNIFCQEFKQNKSRCSWQLIKKYQSLPKNLPLLQKLSPPNLFLLKNKEKKVPLILKWKANWWWQCISKEKRLHTSEYTTPQLVLSLNIANRYHKNYEAITTVTHHFISKFLYFKGFLIQIKPPSSFESFNMFLKRWLSSKTQFKIEFLLPEIIHEKKYFMYNFNWKERY